MKLESLHVLVVGGATAGAAAALLFARAGSRVTLIERSARPQAVGAGIGLAGNGLAVLESIGLRPAIEAAGTPIPAPRIVNGAGRVLLSPKGPVPEGLMIRRSDLQQVLLDALQAQPRVETRLGAEVVCSDRRGGVEVLTVDGVKRLQGDLVIGADGLHSYVRVAGRHGARVSGLGIRYLRAIVPGHVARGEEAWTAAGLFGSFAVGQSTYVYASLGSRELRRACELRDLDGLRAAWARAYPPSAAILAGVDRWEDLLINPVVRVRCRRWFDGRQVLVGDAAHAMAPNLGQSANSALVDGAVLLDEVRRADTIEAALVCYQHRRRSAVARVAQVTSMLGALAEVTNPLARKLRDLLLMPVMARLGGDGDRSRLLQESPEVLLHIGRAAIYSPCQGAFGHSPN